MQVQHESHLLEQAAPLRAEDFNGPGRLHQWSQASKCLDFYVLLSQSNSLNSIEHIVCSPTGNILAVLLSQTNQIYLFAARTKTRLERFPLKPCDRKYSRQSFQVSGMDFSPDGQRLAVGQTDCIVYIYKLPNQLLTSAVQQAPSVITLPSNLSAQSDQSKENSAKTSSSMSKPTITGKFSSSSPITCLIWCELGIVFGGQDGKVRLISSSSSTSTSSTTNAASQTSRLKASVQSSSSSPARVVSVIFVSAKSSMPISLAYKWPLLSIGFIDATVEILLISELQVTSSLNQDQGANELSVIRRNSSLSQLASAPVFTQLHTLETSSSPPAGLHIVQLPTQSTLSICLASSDGRISFYDYQQQQQEPSVQLSSKFDLKEDVQSIDYSHVNEVFALVTRSRLYFIKYEQQQLLESSGWRLQSSSIELTNLFCLTKVCWLRDGAQLALGCSSGSVELFRCSWSKQTIGEQLEICHIAKNRVRITDRERNLLATYKTVQDIKRVNMLDNGQSIIIWTHGNSVLLARLGQWLPQQQSLVNLPSASAMQSSQSGSNTMTRSTSSSSFKFLFEASGFVWIFVPSTRELQLIKLGDNAPVYSVRFAQNEAPKKTLIGARQYPWPQIVASQMLQQRASNAETLSPTSKQQFAPRDNQVRSSSAKSANLQAQLSSNELIVNNSSTKTEANSNNFESASLQLFAFVQQKCHLIVIDLSDTRKRSVLSREFDNEISSIEFSYTGKYLIVRDSMRGQLCLVEFSRKSDSSSMLIVYEKALLAWTDFASFIQGTDSLVVQQGYKVLVWYDLGEPLKRAEEFDIRKLNPNLRDRAKCSDLIDLSFLDFSSAQQQDGGSSSKSRRIPTVNKLTQDQVFLSNGHTLQLNQTKVRFYAHLAGNDLEEAANLLLLVAQSSVQKSTRQTNLLQKLAWMAINNDECELSVRIFSELHYKSICEYLTRCLESENDRQRKVMLSKLCGNWEQFEQLAADLDEITSTYRRLNKWLRLIYYLERAQQFRQRDLAEQELQRWLLSRGRRVDAARRLAASGELVKAVEILFECDQNQAIDCEKKLEQQLFEATRLLLERPQHDDKSLVQVARKLFHALLTRNNWTLAGELAERMLDNSNEAISLYMRGKDFKSALRLALSLRASNKIDQKRLEEIELSFAMHLETLFDEKLLSQRRASSAVEHYEKGGNLTKALQLASKLNAVAKIEQILDQLETSPSEDQSLREECKRVGDALLSSQSGDKKLACRAFKLGGDYDKVVEILLESDQVEQAFQVSLEHLNSNDKSATVVYFDEHAKRLIEQVAAGMQEHEQTVASRAKLKAAELIYVQLSDRPEKAFEMYKRFEMWDEAVALLGRHLPDQLEATLLQLARQFETRGQLEEAERFLLKASPSEWTNVVRMYRLAERWPDAYRVAQANCLSNQDPLLVQLAYWWAKSIVSTASRQISIEDKLVEARTLLVDELCLHKQVVEFCCETKNFQFALDLCPASDKKDESAIKTRRELALRYANYLEQQHKFERAEQILMENDLLELAVRMYVDNDQLQEAIRLIESKLNDSNEQQVSGALGKENETLQLSERLQTTLIDCAQRLANESLPMRAQSRLMARPLVANGDQSTIVHSKQEQLFDKLAQAQQLFLRAQRPDLAIEMYKKRGLWREAIQVAQRFAPRLLEEVEQALDEQVRTDLDPILIQAQKTTNSDLQIINSRQMQEPEEGQNTLNRADTRQLVQQSFGSSLLAGDWRTARTLLMDLIRQTKEQSGDQLGNLEKSLAIASNQDNQIIGQLFVSQPEILEEISALGQWILRGDVPKVTLQQYKQLRNVLALSAQLVWRQQAARHMEVAARPFGTFPSGDNEFERLEQCLLVSHLCYTYLCLVHQCTQSQARTNNGQQHLSIGQAERMFGASKAQTRDQCLVDSIDLLAKLSLSMLRYAGQWICATRALHSAGVWQLACGRRRLARCIFSLLVELVDRFNRNESSALLNAKSESWSTLNKLVDLPSEDLFNGQAPLVDQQQLASDARQWLLETLIEGASNVDAKEEEKLQFDARLSRNCATCLISGLAVDEHDRKAISSNFVYSLEARSSEWNKFVALTGSQRPRDMGKTKPLLSLVQTNKSTFSKRADLLLNEIMDFLQSLGGEAKQ